MREARYVSLIPRTTLHSDSEQSPPSHNVSVVTNLLIRCLCCLHPPLKMPLLSSIPSYDVSFVSTLPPPLYNVSVVSSPSRNVGFQTKEIKRRVESWLKESEEDATKAEEYLDKKREKKAVVLRGSTSDLRAGE
jgi:hypothetical protein